MARKPAPKAKSARKNNKKASRTAASAAKRRNAAAAKSSKGASKASAKSKAAKSVAKNAPAKPAAAKAKKAGKGKGLLKAAKKVLSSAAVTAKAAVNLAVAGTMSRTADKAAKAAPKTPKIAPKAAPKSASLAEGDKVPNFSLPRDGGGTASAADFAGKNLVLFFYPRADTPGCTREAMDFTRLSPQFEAADTAVLGVSADAVKDQDAFREKYCLGVPLVSDESRELIESFGVWGEKSMYGKTFMGIVRTTVLIDKDQRVAKIWRSVSVDGHADEVLAAAKAV